MKLNLIYLTRKQFIIFLVLTLSYFQPAESEPQVNLCKNKNMLIVFKKENIWSLLIKYFSLISKSKYVRIFAAKFLATYAYVVSRFVCKIARK